MSSDPFSEILKFTNAETVVSGGFTCGGRWAVRFPAPDKLKFFALVRGTCRLRLEGRANPVTISAGDVFLLTAQRSFVLASDDATEPIPAAGQFTHGHLTVGHFGIGEDVELIGGHVRVDPVNGALLADVLPPLVHVPASASQAPVLRWLLDQLVRERAADRPGAELVTSQLAHVMFVQLLRAYLETGEELAAGWLRAVSDERIAPALRLMHDEPGRPWTLDELARAAAMSRTAFALHFKTVAGVAPLTYLTRWRMRLAERALREDSTPVAALAGTLGYTSESAFSNAFKRVNGRAPTAYRNVEKARAIAAPSS